MHRTLAVSAMSTVPLVTSSSANATGSVEVTLTTVSSVSKTSASLAGCLLTGAAALDARPGMQSIFYSCQVPASGEPLDTVFTASDGGEFC